MPEHVNDQAIEADVDVEDHTHIDDPHVHEADHEEFEEQDLAKGDIQA